MTDLTPSPLPHGRLASMPKVELHVHLEGSTRAETAVALAIAHGEDPMAVLPFVDGTYPARFDDFSHFVRTYLAVSGLIRTPDDVRTIARDFAIGQLAQHVGWTEVTFTVSTLVNNGLDATAVWEAVRDGLADVPQAPIGLIVDTVRDYGPANATQTLDLVELGLSLGVPIVALGLAGSETSASETDFVELVPGAEQLGLPIVAHAGETGTAENVWRALDLLGSKRIGHGVAAITDEKLMQRLRTEQTVLEVCPTSNVVLGIVPDHDSHPLLALADAGIAVTVNSDDPPFFSTTLTNELRFAQRTLDLDDAGMAALQIRALAASFAPAEVQRAVLEQLTRWRSYPASGSNG
ncbi:MAG: aminodeoxyfutalosine deaminase [Glaciecola sp.]